MKIFAGLYVAMELRWTYSINVDARQPPPFGPATAPYIFDHRQTLMTFIRRDSIPEGFTR